MTVSTTQIRNVYLDPVAPTYPFTFRVLSAADLVVTAIDPAGVPTVLTLDVQYRVSAVNNAGGTVQLLIAPPGAGGRLVIERAVPLTQPTDYANQGTFYPETHERSFDRATLQIQQLADGVQRALTGDPAGFPWYDAQGNRIINLGDAVLPQDAVNLRTLNEALQTAGTLQEPLTWAFLGDGFERTFGIPGAQTDSEGSYQVVIDGLTQDVTDYVINRAAQELTFVVAPPSGAVIFVRSFGFAAPMTAMDWDADGNTIINVGAPVNPTDAATRQFVEDQVATRAALGHTHDAGDVVSGQFVAARLGGGTATPTTVLYGDGQWRVPDATAGLPFVARGDLIAFDGTTAQRLGVGANGEGLIADSSEPLGVRWGSVTVNDEQIQDVVGAMVQTTATVQATYNDPAGTLTLDVVAGSIGATQLADNGVIAGKINTGAVQTAALQDGAVTAVKIGDGQVTIPKLSATGTPSSIAYLRGDGVWAENPFAAAAHTHAAGDVVSGIFNPARLGAGVGSIPPGDEQYFMLNAAGTWTRLEALYDGAVVPVGAGPSGGGGIDAETVRDIIGAALTNTATVTWTYDDGADEIRADVTPGSISLAQVNTASLDTRYALVGSVGGGALPPGGTTRTFLRGDGTWTTDLFATGGNIAFYKVRQEIGAPAGENKAIEWSPEGIQFDLGAAPFFNTRTNGWIRSLGTGAAVTGGSSGTLPLYLDFDAGQRLRMGRVQSGVRRDHLLVDVSTATVTVGSSGFNVNLAVDGNITRGTIGSGSSVTIDASRITSGIAAPARLGGGSPSASTWLRGDGTWATLPSASGITVTDTATIDLTLTAGSNLSAGIQPGSVGPSQLASSLELNANLVIGGATAGISGDKIRLGPSTSVTIDGITNGGASGSLPGGAIQDGGVITRKLGIGAVTTTRLADSSVSTPKIANGSVTPAKLFAGATTPSADTAYFGDGTWRVPAGGSGGGLITGVANTGSVQLTVAGGILSASVPFGGIAPSRLQASSGSPGPTTFYRGDGAWAVPAGGGGASLSGNNVWTNRNEWNQSLGGRQNRAWMAAPTNGEAAFRMEVVTQPVGDRAGVMHIGNIRDGGESGNSFLNVYDVRANIDNFGFFDIAHTDLAYARRLNAGGGFLSAQWMVAIGPNRDYDAARGGGPDPQGIQHQWSAGNICATEINFGNPWADFGLVEDRRSAGRWVAGVQIVADVVGAPHAGRSWKYPAQFGIVFARSGDGLVPEAPDADSFPLGGRQAPIYIPIYIEENSTAPGGYQIKAWGGSTDTLAPYCIIRAAGRFQTGLDLAQATYIEANAPAIKMATGQRVRWGADAEIWFDGTNLRARVGATTVTIV